MSSRQTLSALVLAAAALTIAPSASAVSPRASKTSRSAATLYRDAEAAERRLRASSKRMAKRNEWAAVVSRYDKVVRHYPRSGYCDNALLAMGDLYIEMRRRFRRPRYADQAYKAYRMVAAEYPSSSLGEGALWKAVTIGRDENDRSKLVEAARAYLQAYARGKHSTAVKKLMQRQEPKTPSPAPADLARVFDLRSWSGESSTRVVIDLERKVDIQYDRLENPDRLWIDLLGTRLHPNLAQRVFPVGDGLLERVRVGKNRDHVIRVVLDFKDVWEHKLFYLQDPPRLVVDVRGGARPPVRAATAGGTAASRTSGSSTPGAAGAGAAPRQAASAPAASATSKAPDPHSPAAAPMATATRQPPTSTPMPPAANRAGSYSLARQLGLGARRIVIDPGHGGHDPGTIGRGGLQEKELVLDVALRLERLVRQELGTEVILTRRSDVYVPLEERTAIANSRGADIFLSIHANASRNRKASGIETYFLSLARSSHAKAVAARENAISQATLKDLQGLVKAIVTNSKIDESRDFAAAVHEGMVHGVRRAHVVVDRGVHTAPFYVLLGANMPAVLAEIAFVSNAAEERRLKSGAYRELLARNLLSGLRSYIQALDRTQAPKLTDASPRSTVGSRSKVR